MPELSFIDEVPTQYFIFLYGLAMVCGYALDWALHKWGFGIFLNVAVLACGAFVALAMAEQAGFYFWDDAMPVVMTAIGGAAIMFVVLATAKNKILP